MDSRAQERCVRRRRRRRALLPTSGLRLGASSYRSMRITGRMMTTADFDVRAITGSRAARSAGRKLITVPMSLPPPRAAAAPMRPLGRFESHKVNALLTPASRQAQIRGVAASNPKCCSKGAVTMAAPGHPPRLALPELSRCPEPGRSRAPFRRELDRGSDVRRGPPPRGSMRRGRSAIPARGVPRS